MKPIKSEDQTNELKSWTTAGHSLSPDELMSGILKAEEGPFYTVQESMENFERWLNGREKK